MNSCFALRDRHSDPHLTYLLKTGANSIGRLPSSDVCLAASEVSKRHAILTIRARQLCLEDLASKNGTYVDGERIAGRATARGLLPGSELRFGTLAMRLERLPSRDRELAIRLGDHLSVEAPDRSLPDTAACSAWATSDDGLVFDYNYLRSQAPGMQTIYRQLAAVAHSDIPVLISGETGVGKEGMARLVHNSSAAAGGPFVAINCAALPAELIEAELFGIARGTASGVAGRLGKFELAQGGTLFLDEIGEMTPDLQAKLLRALQEKEIQPLGRAAVSINARIVAATNCQLDQKLNDGSFRQDLYYRLAGLELPLPPLRRRCEDIQPLVERFLHVFSRQAGKTIHGITVEALQRLVDHPWPGNVRQLQHEVRRLVYLCPNFQPITSSLVQKAPAEAAEPAIPGINFRTASSLDLATIEHEAVQEALRRAGGNQSRTAPLLGISRDALRRRLRRHGLQ